MQVQFAAVTKNFEHQFVDDEYDEEDFQDYLQAINNSSYVQPNKNSIQKQQAAINNIKKSQVKQNNKNKQQNQILLQSKNSKKQDLKQRDNGKQNNNNKFQQQELAQNQFHTNSYLNLVANRSKIAKETKQGNKNEEDKQDKQSKIKQTITKLTKNILVSKQQIVNQINSINQYYQQNQKSIKKQQESNKKIHNFVLKRNMQHDLFKYKQNPEIGSKLPIQSKVHQKMKISKEQQMKKKQQERKLKKQILAQQKLARKQQQYIQKDKQKLHKNQLQKRIIYEQKFMSRKPNSKQVAISPQQIKAFQNAFIQQIKQRLNIGKSKNRAKSLDKGLQKLKSIPTPKDQKKKNYNMKLNKGNRLKQKILQNIRHKMEEQIMQGPQIDFQPTHDSILINSKQFEESPKTPRTPVKQRVYRSAPDLRLPAINQRNKFSRRTFFDKDQKQRPKVHILKLSDQ